MPDSTDWHKQRRFRLFNDREAFLSTMFEKKCAVGAVIAASEAKANAQAFIAKNEAERIRLGLTDTALAFPGRE